MTRLVDRVSPLWEVPFALVTWPSFRILRWLLRRLRDRRFRHPERAHRWRWLSPELLATPLALAYTMTSAPRWNPHALIATVGPLDVAGRLTVDVEAARRSAATWTFVAYDHRSMANLGCLDPNGADGQLDLPPGRYILAARYYEPRAPVELPAVAVDGRPLVASAAADADIGAVTAAVARRRRWPYRLLHHHMFVLLRFRRWLPAGLVEREFLPVGNPTTDFRFGIVVAGERLTLDVADRLASDLVLFTRYGRDSFPRQWYAIEEPVHTTAPADVDGFYLVRFHPRGRPK